MTPEQALERNDRYLQLIEAYDLCPFAQRCREEGTLFRQVVSADGILAGVEALHRPERAYVEVGLLILPGLAMSYPEMERLAATLRDQMKQRTLRDFFLVAFHPEAPVDTSTPERLVTLMRRSPDPTFQLVRASLLDRVRGGSETRWVDLKKIDLREPPPPPPPSMSQQIAARNAETVRQLGADRLVEMLAALRA